MVELGTAPATYKQSLSHENAKTELNLTYTYCSKSQRDVSKVTEYVTYFYSTTLNTAT